MSVTAATLLLISAFMHAGWNFISKKEHPTLAFYFVAGIFGALFVLPITIFYYPKIVLIPADVWIFVNISALFLAGYTGIGIFLTYGLVLAAMNYVTNVSYVAAFRQFSIPLGAMSGMVFLNEPRYVSKIAGVILIFLGLILVTVT